MEKEMMYPDLESHKMHANFKPAFQWLNAYERLVEDADTSADEIQVAVVDALGKGSAISLRILPRGKTQNEALTCFWIERVVKMLLWQRGGCQVWVSERNDLVEHLRGTYCSGGIRAFDDAFFSNQVYHRNLEFHLGIPEKANSEPCNPMEMVSNPQGCRIGYDLGGSDRKCAAVMDGEVVFSEEVQWDPYHQSDAQYHIDGVRDSLKRAARHLPRVDAIGGSSAGVIINHVPEVGSLFRGLNEPAMQQHIRPFFRGLSAEWGGIPVTLLNDGEVTALAGASWLGKSGVLGVAMGTSLAAGYVDPNGNAGQFLNELAFCPVDFDPNAPVDEWSGDIGCGVQYFSQQAVFRLAKSAGINIPEDRTLAMRLRYVQDLAEEGSDSAIEIFKQMGRYLGQTIPFWKRFYEFEHLLLLGRVVSGVAGEYLIREAELILDKQMGEPGEKVRIHVPDETFKRHGQAIVAAAIPQLKQ